MPGPAPSPIRWLWNVGAKLYRLLSGRWLPRRAVREAVDQVADRIEADMTARTEALVAAEGEDDDGAALLPLPAWQADMETHVKRAVLAGAIVAAGGLDQFTPERQAAAEKDVERQLTFLAAFAGQVASGEQPLDGTAPARAGMYAGAMVAAHEDAYRDSVAGVFLEERRVVQSGRPCLDCTLYAARGWVAYGTLPPIAADCACKSRCRCRFEYRRRVVRAKPKP